MNQERYKFSDFTRKHYIELLTEAKKRYQFIGYESVLKALPNSILWRHDIDMSMGYALDIAEIEHSLGIKATYFILMHSEFYNLMENSVKNQVEKILSFGHEIGLHFDFSYYGVDEANQLENNLKMETDLLSKIFKTNIKSFSFHNPTVEALQFDNYTYAGLINTYSKEVSTKFYYCSDSNGYWRHQRLIDVITERMPSYLQALTHPIWWTVNIASPYDKIRNCITERASSTLNRYENLLSEAGRIIIDWDE